MTDSEFEFLNDLLKTSSFVATYSTHIDEVKIPLYIISDVKCFRILYILNWIESYAIQQSFWYFLFCRKAFVRLSFRILEAFKSRNWTGGSALHSLWKRTVTFLWSHRKKIRQSSVFFYFYLYTHIHTYIYTYLWLSVQSLTVLDPREKSCEGTSARFLRIFIAMKIPRPIFKLRSLSKVN